jgi:glycosyltransferase involved in cell wall biosynthesis
VPPIRIDHLITRLILGGAQENTVLTCEGLHADPRFDVRLITGPAIGPEGELLARARGEGYEVVVLDAMRRAIHPWRDLVSLWKLWRLFRRRAPDIVHTHSSKAGILGRIAARLAGVPVVIHTIHGLPFHEYQPAVARMFYRFLERRCAALTDRIICVGEAMKQKALAAKLGRPEDIDVVYSGIEIDQFSDGPSTVRAMHAFAVDDVVIGTVSRLAPLKGHADLLEAVKPLQEKDPKVRLLLVGDGELRQDVERAAGARAVFAGMVTPDRIPEYLRAMDIVVHPSLREGLPRAVVQALLCGRPVIAVDCDGAREVVIEGETGSLVPPGSVPELTRALERMLALPDRGRALGQEGRRRFAGRFDHRVMVDRLAALYEAAMAAPRA